ncbi:MAG TPA: sigma-70 family RNA polymerase sigma factor [Flavisolibacter sp.]|nr:sigma-70 family RNA polymerase sigma factor [Flavisolibacter sp.]
MLAVKDEVSSWVKAYTADLFSYTISKVPDEATAEDIVQETFLSALEAYHTFQQKSAPKTWLFSILKHKIADYYRQKYKQVENLSNGGAVGDLFDSNGRLKAPCSSIEWRMEEELFDDPKFLQALHHCIEALPQKMSTVVELKYLKGANSEYVCQQLNITQSNFWQIMHRAKLLLKSCIENKWFRTGSST